MSVFDWTEDRISQLKTLWLAGSSGDEIAHALNCGNSRKYIYWKARALGLPGRAHARTQTRTQVVAAPSFPKPLLDHPEPLGEPGTFVAHGFCKYIHGDPCRHDWRMCGHATGSIENPWCEFHRKVVFASKPEAPEAEEVA